MGATSGLKLTYFSAMFPSGPPENIRNRFPAFGLNTERYGVSLRIPNAGNWVLMFSGYQKGTLRKNRLTTCCDFSRKKLYLYRDIARLYIL